LDRRRGAPATAIAATIFVTTILIVLGRRKRGRADDHRGGNQEADTSPLHLESLLTDERNAPA
jgi:hypothetical protein